MGKQNSMGNFLRRARERAGLTQAELAEELGLGTPQFVSNWERGVAIPPLKRAQDLSRALGVSREELARAFHNDAHDEFILRREQIDRALWEGGRRR